MTTAEFVQRAMAAPGIPWVRWASSWMACDCYGVILLWLRECRGIDLGAVPQTDIATGFAQARGWVECGPEPEATAWMAWAAGAPAHCGVLVAGGMVLHSDGTEDRPGSVRLTRLTVMRRRYSDITFYRPPAC
jgi:cell wall-associated NlpC family hydrolase